VPMRRTASTDVHPVIRGLEGLCTPGIDTRAAGANDGVGDGEC
jgi:hypothetical protein